MRKAFLVSLPALFLALSAIAGTAQERVSATCRREIAALCAAGNGAQRGAMRACIAQRYQSLSDECRAELRKRLQARREGREAGLPAGAIELAYGADPRQRLDLARPADTRTPAPLIVFVHGGGWTRGDKRQGAGEKPAFYTGIGHAFATVNYRLVPGVTPAEQAQDIAAAIALLRGKAGTLGLDPQRIVLMGHSAGAHLIALVATDTRYLDAAGIPSSAISGVVLLDGAGYDVSRQIAAGRAIARNIYARAFGTDPARQSALSPVTHATAPNVGRWLILHAERRDDARDQAALLSAALTRAGARAAVVPVKDGTHMKINRDAGMAGTLVSEQIRRFLEPDRVNRERLARPS